MSRTLVRLPLAILPAILACELLETRRHFRWAIAALVCAALLDAGYGLYFVARGAPLHPDRFSGLMGVNFSAIVVLTGAAMSFARLGRTREPIKLALPALLALLGVATLSKMGGIALLLSGSIILWTVCSRANRRRVLLAGACALVLALSQTSVRERLVARTIPEIQHDGVLRTSTDVRMLILRSAWTALDEQAVAGIGFSGFQEYSKRDPVILTSTAGQGYATHNTYLEVLVEGGLIAFIPFFLHLLGLTVRFGHGWQVIRRDRDGVVAAVMGGCLIVLISAAVANVLLHYFFWSVCGITLACLEHLRRSTGVRPGGSLADVV